MDKCDKCYAEFTSRSDTKLHKRIDCPSSDPPDGSTADAIVDELFRNGFGDEAERLVFEVPGKQPGNACGWCRDAVRDVITKHLSR